jgi:dienelactone hydrolase
VSRGSRRAVAAAGLALIAGAGACGDREPAPLEERTVGRGPVTTTIIQPAQARGPVPVVVFLHGWGATQPQTYRPWLEHLARRGNTVIYPRYQESVLTPPPQALGNALAGIRLALSRVEEDPRRLVAAGHSAGGALAADYAAIARRVGLPVPRAVYAVYPGRSLRGIPASLPEVPGIPRGVRVLAAGSTADRVVGTRVARAIARAAPGGRYVEVRDPAVRDHRAPQRSDAASRRAFWRTLDGLITRTRR